jgi:hypothetical protein
MGVFLADSVWEWERPGSGTVAMVSQAGHTSFTPLGEVYLFTSAVGWPSVTRHRCGSNLKLVWAPFLAVFNLSFSTHSILAGAV